MQAAGWTSTGEENFDTEFLKAVVEDVDAKYTLDRQRLYCCGFSNGGMMTYVMANTCSPSSPPLLPSAATPSTSSICTIPAGGPCLSSTFMARPTIL